MGASGGYALAGLRKKLLKTLSIAAMKVTRAFCDFCLHTLPMVYALGLTLHSVSLELVRHV